MNRSRAFSLAVAVAMALILILSTGLMAANGAVVKKTFTAALTSSPSPAIANQQATYTVTVKNTATAQSLGSCNLTKPTTGGFTLSPPTTPPATGTVAISADGNSVELRNLGTLPGQSRTATFRATATTPGTHKWTIECRQANNYSPDQPSNRFSTSSVLETSVAAPTSPNLSVEFVDQDLATAGTQGDTLDPVTGGYVTAYVLRVVNSGTAAGSGTLNDHTTKGSIVAVDGCAATITGADASCEVTVPAGSSSGDIRIQVQAPTVTENDSMENRASVGSSTAQETTVIVPASSRCTDSTGTYDCVRTVLDSRRDLLATTGTPTSSNQFSMSVFIKGDPTAPVSVSSVVFRETFDDDTCDPQECTGNNVQGNVVEFGTLPAWCGPIATAAKCKITVSYNVGLVPDGSLLLAQQTADGYWEDDAGVNQAIFRCNDGAHGGDPKCENSRVITGTDLTNGYITFEIYGTAGDGRTGYCVGTFCV